RTELCTTSIASTWIDPSVSPMLRMRLFTVGPLPGSCSVISNSALGGPNKLMTPVKTTFASGTTAGGAVTGGGGGISLMPKGLRSTIVKYGLAPLSIAATETMLPRLSAATMIIDPIDFTASNIAYAVLLNHRFFVDLPDISALIRF